MIVGNATVTTHLLFLVEVDSQGICIDLIIKYNSPNPMKDNDKKIFIKNKKIMIILKIKIIIMIKITSNL